MRSRLWLVLLCAISLGAAVASQADTQNITYYRLRRRDPEGCDPEEDCDYFMGVNTNSSNSSYLDFYLVGRAAGWVAVGFSPTANTYDADVLACSVAADNETAVLAIDTYNNDDYPGGSNQLDNSERDGHPVDIIQYAAMYEDGRIICSFSRLIPGIDPAPQDKDLNRSYYFIFGTSDNGRTKNGVEALSAEEDDPDISNRKLNPTTDSGEITISTFHVKLIQAHCILMLIAWPMITFTGIFFAVWMKPALPNGEWFKVHQAFNIAGLLVAVVAFALVFIAHKNQMPAGLIELGSDNITGTCHFAMGILIMALHIANPIISLFRCKPNSKHRWIFILIHGIIIGIGLHLLVFVNVGVGVSIFSMEQSSFGDLTLLWVYLAFAIFTFVLLAVLFVLFTGEATLVGGGGGEDQTSIVPSCVKLLWLGCTRYTLFKTERIELEETTGTSLSCELTKPSGPPPRKPPSRDAPLRWIALGVFLAVMVPFILALIVLIAVRVNY